MSDHILTWLLGGIGAAVGASIATRVQLLPDVVDLSIILTGAGFGGYVAALIGAVQHWPPERLGRVVLLGNLVGGLIAAIFFLLALVL